MTAGKEIGAGKSHKGQACTIGTAADGLYDGGDAAGFHSLFCQIYNFHTVSNFGCHIIVLIFQFQCDGIGILDVFPFHNEMDEIFSVGKSF